MGEGVEECLGAGVIRELLRSGKGVGEGGSRTHFTSHFYHPFRHLLHPPHHSHYPSHHLLHPPHQSHPPCIPSPPPAPTALLPAPILRLSEPRLSCHSQHPPRYSHQSSHHFFAPTALLPSPIPCLLPSLFHPFYPGRQERIPR